MTTYTKLRLTVTATSGGDPSVQIAEMRAESLIGGANVCTGGTASASGATTTYVASKAFDELIADANSWMETLGSSAWLQYDFAAPVEIRQVRITPWLAVRAPKDYTIEAFDGTSWITLASNSNDTAWLNVTERAFSTVDDRTVSVTLNSTLNRRPSQQPVARLAVQGNVINFRPGPTTSQFSGIVGVGVSNTPAAREVHVRLRDGTLLEAMQSDASTGAFGSIGWYPVRDDYELHVIGEGYVSRSFPTNAPAAVQWNGNPLINDSGVIGEIPPEDMFFTKTTLADSALNIAYNDWLLVTNAVGAITWLVTGTLPAGITHPDPSQPNIIGTPTESGAFPITVRATDSLERFVEQAVTLTVSAAGYAAILYTGNGVSARNVTAPVDLSNGGALWVFSRSVGRYADLYVNQPSAGGIIRALTGSVETADTSPEISLATPGVIALTGTRQNTAGTTYAAYCMKRKTGFMDVVSWVGDGTASKAVPHALGVVPHVAILHVLGSDDRWVMYTSDVGNTKSWTIGTTSAPGSATVTAWNNTSPTSTHFTVGSASNAAGTTYVAVLFARDGDEVDNGRYTGNGSSTGPVVTLGWQPKFVLIKQEDTSGTWSVFDTERSPGFTGADLQLYAAINTLPEQAASHYIDLTADGFQLKSASADVNANAKAYFYLAFR